MCWISSLIKVTSCLVWRPENSLKMYVLRYLVFCFSCPAWMTWAPFIHLMHGRFGVLRIPLRKLRTCALFILQLDESRVIPVPQLRLFATRAAVMQWPSLQLIGGEGQSLDRDEFEGGASLWMGFQRTTMIEKTCMNFFSELGTPQHAECFVVYCTVVSWGAIHNEWRHIASHIEQVHWHE